MKKLISCLCIALILGGCSSKKAEMKEGKGEYTNESGEVSKAIVKTADGKISEVSIDETDSKSGKTKKALGNDYQMKEASKIGKEWYQQIEFLENYIVKNGVDNISVNSEGKAENQDVLTGCTIRIDGFLKAVKDAKANTK